MPNIANSHTMKNSKLICRFILYQNFR